MQEDPELCRAEVLLCFKQEIGASLDSARPQQFIEADPKEMRERRGFSGSSTNDNGTIGKENS